MEAKYKFKRYWNRIKRFSILPKHGIVEVRNVAGKYVPLKPFPMRFFVTAEVVAEDKYEFTKLTFTNLVITIVKNFITMNYHRFMLILHWIGFLETPFGYCLDWSWFRWDFWNVRKYRRLGINIENEIMKSLDKQFIRKIKRDLMEDRIKGREN